MPIRAINVKHTKEVSILSIFICEDEPQLLRLYEDAVHKEHKKGIYFLDIDLGTGKEGRQIIQLKELTPDLAPYMLNCRSFIIVNKQHIKNIDSKNLCVHLHAGYTCDISVRYLKKSGRVYD